MKTLGKITLSIILDFVGYFISGLVYMKYWAWFISEMFGVFAISFKQAIAIIFVVQLLKYKYTKNKKEYSFSDILSIKLTVYVMYFIILGFGYIAYLLIRA